MGEDCYNEPTDYGACSYATNIGRMARQNTNFRNALWTGCNLQMTLMSIPRRGEIGVEIHEDTDQFIRVEQGQAMVMLGKCESRLDMRQGLMQGDAVFVPAGTWHNIINVGNCCLKVSSIYAPPHHPWGTVQQDKDEKKECMQEEECMYMEEY